MSATGAVMDLNVFYRKQKWMNESDISPMRVSNKLEKASDCCILWNTQIAWTMWCTVQRLVLVLDVSTV